MRLTGTAVDCYKYLEPLYNDYRKIKTQNRNGGELSACFIVTWRHVHTEHHSCQADALLSE